MACKDKLAEMLYDVTYDNDNLNKIDKGIDKATKFDNSLITKGIVSDFLSGVGFTHENAIEAEKVMGKLVTKLNGLKKVQYSDISTYLDAVSSPTKVVPYNIALKELFDSQTGEFNKVNNSPKVQLTQVSDKGIMNVPVARAASVIGRKYMRTAGFRFHVNHDEGITPIDVETMYNKVGRIILGQMENDGLVDVVEGQVVNDFVDASAESVKRDEPIRKTLVVRPKLESLVNEKDTDITLFKNIIRGTAQLERPRTPYDDIITTVNAVNIMKTPLNITLPTLSPQTVEALEQGDYSTVSKTASKVRKILHDNPVYINPRIVPYFRVLSEKWKKYPKGGFKRFVNDVFGSDLNAYTALGVKSSDLFTLDLRQSVDGQNLSKTAPLQDLLEQFDNLVGDNDTPNGLHMQYNFVRNARLHMMNSVVNAQSSPYMRYLITGGENTFSLNNDEHVQHFLAHLLDQGSNVIPNVELTADKITGIEVDEKLNEWVDLYEEYFINTNNGEHQANMISDFTGTKNSMATLDTLGAIYDFRKGMNSTNKMVTTSFNTKPDATASGGTITLLQAVGNNPKVVAVLTRLGLLDSDTDVLDTLNDIYGLLTDRVTRFMDVLDKGGKKDYSANQNDDVKKVGVVKELLESGVYGDFVNDRDKTLREMSKDPTMTFIYNQQELGAVNTIASNITERLLTSVKKKSTRDYISKLLGEELTKEDILSREGIRTELIKALSDKDAAPKYLYDQLGKEVNELVDPRKDKTFQLYDAIADYVPMGKIKILPNIAVVDGIENTAENRKTYGIPLAKIMNIINDTADGDILTMEERGNRTTTVVNTTHGTDASGLYTGADATLDIIDPKDVTGMIPVHDEFIASTVFNTENVKQYPIALINSIKKYSVEEQLLEQLEQIDPNNKLIADGTFREELESSLEDKAKVLDSFNFENGSVFGEKSSNYKVPKKYIRPTKPKPTPPNKPKKSKATESVAEVETTTESTTTVEPEVTTEAQAVKPEIVRGKELKSVLEKLAETSTIVRDFLKGQTRIGRVSGKKFEFRPKTDYVVLGNISPINDAPIDYESEHFKELIEHEIYHSATVAYLKKEFNNPSNHAVRYLKKYFNNTKKRLDSVINNPFRDNLSEEALERLDYVFTRTSEFEQFAEFAAILGTENQVRADILTATEKVSYSLLEGVKAQVIKMGRAIENLIKKGEWDNSDGVEIALIEIYRGGKRYKESNYKEAMKIQKDIDNMLANNSDNYARHEQVRVTAPERVVANTMDRINTVTQNVLTARVERIAIGTGTRINTALKNSFPMYADVRERMIGVYESTPELQRLVHYMNLDNFKSKIEKNKILSMIHNIHEERNARESQQMQLLADLTHGFDEDGKKALYDLVSKVPLHNFFRNDETINTSKDLDNRISLLEKELTVKDNSRVNDTVSLVVNDEVKEYSMFNTGDYYDSSTTDYAQVEELIALKAIKEASLADTITNLKANHTELYTIMKDNSLALSELSYKLADTNPSGKRLKETLVKDVYKENLEFKVITLDNQHKYSYEDTAGWKILRAPTDSTLGVVYKEKIDEYFVEGAGVSEDIISPDLTVPKYLANSFNHLDSNIVKAGEGYKLVLTQEEKVLAGVKEDMIETLVRSTSSTIAADDSLVVRNLLLSQALHSTISSVDGDAVDDILTRIKSKTIDHPWTIKLDDKVKYADLDPKIKALYKPIQQNMTTIGKFNENVDLVRKDISPWLVGGHHPSLFKNPKLKYISRVVKSLVSTTKIGMISVNPAKLATDISSNTAHLAMLGVPASKTLRYGKDILGEVNTFNTLKNAATLAKLKYLANPTDKNQKVFDNAITRLKTSTIYGAYENGFMNSLSSDILNNAVGTTSGLQEDIKRVLEYFTTSSGRGNIEKGEKNGFHKLVSTASKFGFDGEELLRFMGKQISRFETKKDFEAYLNKVANNITRMKTQEDVVGYLSQFTLSPNSEFVKGGTWINSMADLMFRETYKRHLMDGGMSEKNAVIGAIEQMPDYKQNMPLSVKVLSDYGVLMFPSWFLRTPVISYKLIKNKLTGVGIEEQMQLMLGVDIETMFDESILKKIDSGLLHSPDEYIGVDSILPTNLFNF